MNQPNLNPMHPLYVVSVQSDFQQPDPVEANQSLNGELSATLGFFVLFSSFVLLLCSMHRWKAASETPTFSDEIKTWSDKLAFDLPCRNCQYFKANRYLPCAVNPIHVLTAEAAHCTDFREREKD